MDEGLELLSGWGGTAPTACRVIRPTLAADVQDVVKSVGERGLVARGLARSYGDAAQCAGGTALGMTRLASLRAIDVDDALVTVDAGMSLQWLMRVLVPLGLFPAVTPGTALVTVGGAIAADVHGKNHHAVGSFCDHVAGLTLVTPDGPRYVSPDVDHDVFWATAGGMGLTGVVTEATLRLKQITTSYVRVDTERGEDLDDLMARMDADDDRYEYSVAWVDLMATGRSTGRGVLGRGNPAAPDECARGRQGAPPAYEWSPVAVAPRWFPNWLLKAWSVRAFNELWYRKAPRHEKDAIVSLGSFHHPLDRVDGWNRVYGRRGFVQYQFVVPFGSAGEETLKGVVERLARHGAPCFLAVLKRFGAQNAGHLSFPMPGWTLALDVPARVPGLASLLDEFDEQVLEAGGRLYLAKESRAKPRVIHAMYPRLEQWREVRERIDPGHVLQSDLARRLGLCRPT